MRTILLLRLTRELAREELHRVHRRNERLDVVLCEVADAQAAIAVHLRSRVSCISGERLGIELYLASKRIQVACEQLDQCRLSSTVASHDRNAAVQSDVDVDLVQDRRLGWIVPECDVAQLY